MIVDAVLSNISMEGTSLRDDSQDVLHLATESPSFTVSELSAAAQVYFNLGISIANRKAYTAGLHNITHSAGRLTNHVYQFVKIHCCCLHRFGPTRSILCNDISVPI